MDKSLIDRLKYIKNVDRQDIKDDKVWDWAYKSYKVGEEDKDYEVGEKFQLHFHSERGEERIKNHVLELCKGALIILSQKPPKKDRCLTHVVELVNEGFEDQSQWTEDPWGIFRSVKVHWIANFNDLSNIPLDKDVMGVEDWGYQNTLAKSLTGKNLKKRWNDIETLREHLQGVFCLN